MSFQETAALLLWVVQDAQPARACARCALSHLADMQQPHVNLEIHSATATGPLELPGQHGGPLSWMIQSSQLAPARACALHAELLGQHGTTTC